MISKMREEFESWWYASKYCQVVNPSANAEQTAWDSWQASRASIEVELPSYLDHTGCRHAIECCAEAIESLGLKVKP